MTADRIKEIQDQTAFPDSVSVCQALLQVWNECQKDMADKIKEAYEQGLKDGYACMPSINSLNKQD